MSRMSKSQFMSYKGKTIRLQEVSCGEDIKVRYASFGDISVENVRCGCASTTIKVRVVSCGEDIKLCKKDHFGDIKVIG